MVFSSISFLFYFLPIVLMCFYIAPKKFKNIVLLIASISFYFLCEPKYVVLMLFSIIITYIFGILIEKNRKNAKLYLIFNLIIILGVLVYFKYFNFIIRNINLYLSNKIDFIFVALPVGISFYTFQLISYIVDVYKNETKAQKNILKLALYISLFPQLIAGPIVRYSDIEKQLDERKYSFNKFSLGVRKFIIGLGKKVLIANILGELVNSFLVSTDRSTLYYWLYAISNMLQIYFDFSGYSDMAIGLGRMFGFEFEENFNYPYISKSITEFWRRWHISLSTWFKDYVYIPLGGNRKGKIRLIINIFIVWMLTGLWHGAEWNFVLWGIYFGVILIIEKLFLYKFLEKMPNLLQRIYTLFIVMISFIIFSGESFSQIGNNIAGLFGTNLISKESIYYLKSYFVVILAGIIGSTPLFNNDKFKNIKKYLEPVILLMILILSSSYIIDGSFNPFLYFRF